MRDTQSEARAETILALFPQISVGEWLLALAVQIDGNKAKHTGGPVYKQTLICHHCAKASAATPYGLRRHHGNNHKDCKEFCETLRSVA